MRAALAEIDYYRRAVGATFRGQMQYRASFALRVATDFAVIFADFVPVYVLLGRFGSLEGWSLAEVAVLFGMVQCAWGTVELGARGFENFGRLLIRGELDRMLLRPRSLIAQIAAHDFDARRLGKIAQGAVVLGVGGTLHGLEPGAWLWVVYGTAGGIAFFSGVVLLAAASQFYTLGQTSELQNMLTYGGTAALSYPVSVYARWFRRAITYAIPLACVNYFPGLAALGRLESAGVPGFVPWISPVVCLGFMALGHVAFRRALGRYESTGS